MQLIFERGDRNAPVGHALIYFRGSDNSILATYVSVPPIKFDLSRFVPGFLAGALQGMDVSEGLVAAPMPPMVEEVPGIDYLHALAERRQDDLVFAGGTMRDDPMRLMGETQEAAREYGELYQASALPDEGTPAPAQAVQPEAERYADMSERELLNELTRLTGRMRDSLAGGTPDEGIERQMNAIVSLLPAKYRAERLVAAARTPGERYQRLAELYLERSYKLFNEEYLDLERIDREIEALAE